MNSPQKMEKSRYCFVYNDGLEKTNIFKVKVADFRNVLIKESTINY